jgi:lipopolysaccharide/colanic/teichoic acid biosynthesis glycosyltransferase
MGSMDTVLTTLERDVERATEIPPVPTLPESLSKRAMDVALAAVGLVALSPLFIVCAVLAKAQSPGRALFWGPRIGRGGRRFLMAKFRTMVADAPGKGPGVTAQDDPRMTPIGRFLRKTKLDELPQLLNVLNGTMSLVGPRPELPRYVACYNERQRRVLSVRPGITGPTQIAYRHEQELLKGQPDVEAYYITVLMPAKLEMDLSYIERRRFWTDVAYLFKTLGRVFSRT